ncbi:hypothetical protein EOD10_03435 [Mesorhizobium sp. M7A.T.Ca.TU.009.01.3.2]|nr:hypothetical protein EOD10_03435 [Mesorhizobium sp. M7A.T.Ca.TU.009.01.3.2]RUU75991.1 hypothetical protein EOD00_37840 [Mesorhizobium sp. M7A.T.Ca.TU.009.01.3.1]RUV17269.1 hypothetical protein EOB80_27855 [Mesorhizobium sp. M7A.F.Ca.MR.245.00.0.0]RUV52094.1 hypothetical protein EOB77_08180 [Mesorhizobium sp. M7A.F.Ca.MR.228.00.0.0]
MRKKASAIMPEQYEPVWKLCSCGHLRAFSALPVLAYSNVRSAPVLENTVTWLTGARSKKSSLARVGRLGGTDRRS